MDGFILENQYIGNIVCPTIIEIDYCSGPYEIVVTIVDDLFYLDIINKELSSIIGGYMYFNESDLICDLNKCSSYMFCGFYS